MAESCSNDGGDDYAGGGDGKRKVACEGEVDDDGDNDSADDDSGVNIKRVIFTICKTISK